MKLIPWVSHIQDLGILFSCPFFLGSLSLYGLPLPSIVLTFHV